MYRDTITLFNRKKSKEGTTWFPTILKGVDFNADKASILKIYGADATDNAVLHVKYTITGGKIVIGNKTYISPKEWVKTEDLSVITFTTGNEFDFFYVGEWESEEPIADSNYITSKYEGFYDYMNSYYDEVYSLSQVSRFSVIPHFEILAK